MFPKDCPECVDDFDALVLREKVPRPARRSAHTEDSVISFFFQIGGQTVNEGLNALAAKRLDPHPNLQYFYVPGSGHVMLNEPENVSQNGVQLVDWLSDMLEGKESWKSVKP